ncbi:hypothetical protein B0H14DRAFT_2914705 [Mycena olivaceomarginata]|nr:hypothetical protein B0H14DRAFT_2914705 [Mycena olivaceomarginata]
MCARARRASRARAKATWMARGRRGAREEEGHTCTPSSTPYAPKSCATCARRRVSRCASAGSCARRRRTRVYCSWSRAPGGWGSSSGCARLESCAGSWSCGGWGWAWICGSCACSFAEAASASSAVINALESVEEGASVALSARSTVAASTLSSPCPLASFLTFAFSAAACLLAVSSPSTFAVAPLSASTSSAPADAEVEKTGASPTRGWTRTFRPRSVNPRVVAPA